MIPIMNAAGDCKHLEQVRELARTPVSEVTVGSILMAERAGNEGNTFWTSDEDTVALNSKGLPCRGKDYYVKHLPTMAEVVRKAGKKLRINIAGFNADDYEMIAAIAAPHADILEINLGCPNVWSKEGEKPVQKPIASFDLDYSREIIIRVRAVEGKSKIAVKYSPFSDPSHLDRMASLAAEMSVDEVVTSNTFANALMFEKGKPAISPNEGLAGMSGPALKAIALGQVAQFKKKLPPQIKIVGVGGGSSAQDVLDFRAAGADKVQIGTYSFKFGPKVFGEIIADMPEDY